LAYDINLYVLSINASSNAGQVIDSIEGIYTPGAADFIMEDCFGFADMDGDGLPPSQDPDCESFMKNGGMIIFEDCHDPWGNDEDGDGYANCNDPDCLMMPHCGGSLFDFEADENDTTQATIARYEVDSYPDSAFVMYDSSEPANGTLFFYGTDSQCRNLSATIYDIGITDSDVPKYKMWHDGPIDEAHINYTLAVNTSYFYKLSVCDKAGNPCGSSACLNFTTEVSFDDCGRKCEPVFDVKYTPPSDDPYLADADMQWDFGDGYVAKGAGCGGTGGFKKPYNETKNIKFKIENDEGDTKWNMEFNNMSATGIIDPNATKFNPNEIKMNSSGDNKYVGMDHDAWKDFKDEFNPKSFRICVPGQVTTLYHCANESAVSVSDCTDVTDQAIAGPTYNSTLECTHFTVPADLGFSVYFGSGTTGGGDDDDDSGGSGGSGGGAAPSFTKSFVNGKITFEGKLLETVRYMIGGNSHSVRIDAINDGSVDLLIKSVIIQDTINLGKTKSYDVTKDGRKDINIKLDSISADKTNATLIISLLTYATEEAPVIPTTLTPTIGELKDVGRQALDDALVRSKLQEYISYTIDFDASKTATASALDNIQWNKDVKKLDDGKSTSVEITVKNIGSDTLTALVLIEAIPKAIIENIAEIKDPVPNYNLIIKEDPIIQWRFKQVETAIVAWHIGSMTAGQEMKISYRVESLFEAEDHISSIVVKLMEKAEEPDITGDVVSEDDEEESQLGNWILLAISIIVLAGVIVFVVIKSKSKGKPEPKEKTE